MAIGKKIRVYDLAKEVKQDTKRIMEDLRREGADISVPSNSVSAELADKIRQRYIPKAEVAPKRTVKVIKATKKAAAPVEPIEEPVAEAEPTLDEAPVEVPVVESKTETVEEPVKAVRKVLKIKQPVAEASTETTPEVPTVEPEVEEAAPAATDAKSNGAAEKVAPPAAEPKRILRPTGTQIKTERPSSLTPPSIAEAPIPPPLNSGKPIWSDSPTASFARP